MSCVLPERVLRADQLEERRWALVVFRRGVLLFQLFKEYVKNFLNVMRLVAPLPVIRGARHHVDERRAGREIEKVYASFQLGALEDDTRVLACQQPGRVLDKLFENVYVSVVCGVVNPPETANMPSARALFQDFRVLLCVLSNQLDFLPFPAQVQELFCVDFSQARLFNYILLRCLHFLVRV